MDANREIAAQLKSWRERRHLSQANLADRINVSRSHYTRLERGERPLHPVLADALDKALDTGGLFQNLREGSAADPSQHRSSDAASPGESSDRGPFVPFPNTVHFTGRADEVQAVCQTLTGQLGHPRAAGICVISGMPGIGKTALARCVAHLLADRFPDGCLCLDLQGFAPGVTPLTDFDALGLVLAMLGVPDEQIPAGRQARVVRYHREIAGRRLLLLLDDAVCAQQISCLMPPTAGCSVLVTSRNRLTALDDAHRVVLPVLPPEQAAELFCAVAEYRGGDQTSIDGILAACGGVPLALRIVAARCRPDSGLTPADLAARLAHPRSRLTHLADNERAVSDAFGASLDLLPSAQRRLFLLLGLHPAKPLSGWAAAALADIPAEQAERGLEELVGASLLEPRGHGRFRVHDLLAEFAASAVRRELPATEIWAATGRMLDAYAVTAEAADRLLTPYRHRLSATEGAATGSPPQTFEDDEHARSWLTDHLDTLSALCVLAATDGWDERSWQLAYSLRGVFFLGRHWRLWRATHEAALPAAVRAGNRIGTGMTLANLGFVLGETHDFEAAMTHLGAAVEVFRDIGDRHGEFTAQSHLAWIQHCTGDYREALAGQTAALEFRQAVGTPRNVAIIMRDMAATELALGKHGEARDHLQTAVAMFTELGLRLDLTMALNGLGELAVHEGDTLQADVHHYAALNAARRSGSVFEQARAHAGLGRCAVRRGRPARARHQLTRALRLYDTLGAGHVAAAVHAELAALDGAGISAARTRTPGTPSAPSAPGQTR
ncbi:helix-turn-helix domain-containing protein [Catenulispora acidiphila]|uniref:helix-turn-helix domain-containing protein n=1 Tax=Catenulispora acidiphila TaxID=304895 RepID=UPI000306B3B8|nr:helix-turn-helix domain-containing protein [Catenulispora acidiphila]